MEFPNVPLDAFHLCIVKTEAFYEIGYPGFSFVFGQSASCSKPSNSFLIGVDLATFVMIVYYAIHSKSRYGMPYIVKGVLEDATIYFIVVAVCHLGLALSVIFAKVMVLSFPRICV